MIELLQDQHDEIDRLRAEIERLQAKLTVTDEMVEAAATALCRWEGLHTLRMGMPFLAVPFGAQTSYRELAAAALLAAGMEEE